MIQKTTRPGPLPLATLGLIGLNIAVFLIMRYDPLLKEALILDPSGFRQAPWALLSVIFTHDNVLQLTANMALLFFAGRSLEQEIPPWEVILAFLLTGTAGSLISLLYVSFAEPVRLIPGASAAVFGLIALYASLRADRVLFGRSLRHWVMFFLIYTVVALVISPSPVAGGPAHAGGTLTGLLLGRYLKKRTHPGQ